MLFAAFPARTTLLAFLAMLSGALPAAFAYLTGRLVEAFPAAVQAADGRSLVAPLSALGVVLLGQPLVDATRAVVVIDLYWRYDDHLLGRVMTTTSQGPGLELFEDPELAARTDRAVRIAKFGPGELVGGLSAKWTARAQGLSATVLVANPCSCESPNGWPIVAAVLLVLWLSTARFLQADFYRANPFWTEPLRRAQYLKRLGLMPDAAKEQRIFGFTDWLVDRFGREWATVMAELWRSRRIGFRTMGLLTPMLLIANLVVLLLAVRSAMLDELSVAELTVVIQGLFGMVALASLDGDIWIENGAVPVPDVLEHERAVAAKAAGAKAVAARAAGSPGRKAAADGLPADEIRLENVGFAYPGRDPVYESLDLTIKAGRSLAIVGLNGAGKTTLVKLLTGLSTPQSGRITIDGIELADLDLAGWRRQIAAIFQDFTRYQLPVRDNIGFGAIDGPAVDIVAAAERAAASDVINGLPAGLDTVLSRRYPGGVDLSGGQWQRIGLARAMAAVAAGARVLVLDEPTAQLDVRAEAELYDRFLDLTHGLTTIVISHRFSTVRRADRIVVLDNGRVTESGSHDELLAAAGQYARLFRIQADRYADRYADRNKEIT